MYISVNIPDKGFFKYIAGLRIEDLVYTQSMEKWQ